MNLYSKWKILLKCKLVDHISFLSLKYWSFSNRTNFMFKEREEDWSFNHCVVDKFNNLSTGS